MGKLRDARNKNKESALIDRIPRIEIELAGLGTDLTTVQNTVTVIEENVQNLTTNGDLKVGVFRLNSQELSNSFTVPVGKSAMCVGPITVPVGKSLTVPSGSRLVIL